MHVISKSMLNFVKCAQSLLLLFNWYHHYTKLIHLLRFRILCLFDTTLQGLAPLVAMETPLGSGAAPIFVYIFFLHNPTANCAAYRELSCANSKCGWIDGCMCMRVSGSEKKKEIKTRWNGLREWMETGGGGENDKERNEWWRQRQTRTQMHADHTLIYSTHILQQRWLDYVRVSEQGESVWVEGCRNSAAYFAFRLIPANVSLGLLTALPQANSHSMMPNPDVPSLLSQSLIMIMFFRSPVMCIVFWEE